MRKFIPLCDKEHDFIYKENQIIYYVIFMYIYNFI